jgi:hypothetical protein
MTYYRWNTKYIAHAEKALKQFEAQKGTMVSYLGIGIIFSVICICGWVTKQYIVVMLAVLVGICGAWGAGTKPGKSALLQQEKCI